METVKNNTNSEVGEEVTAITLDLTGLKCPLPVLKARRQISQMAAGEVLLVKADDPAAPLDFDHFCHTSNHKLLEIQENLGIFVMRIVKSGK